MTTIAFDGKVVAADRRITRKGIATEEERIKIRIPHRDVKFRGDEVLFVAGTGKSIVISAAVDIIFDEQNPVYFFNMVRKHHFLSSVSEESRIMVGCPGVAYIIVISYEKVEVFKVTLNDRAYLIGSGKSAAKVLQALCPSTTPFELIAAAAIGDTVGTGTNIDVYDTVTKDLTNNTNTREELIEVVKKATRRKTRK
jgi:hypothetical protein